MMRHRLLYTLSGWISLLFLYTSCSNEVEFPDSKDELVTVRLTATINSKEFSTDNEIVPMRTRTNSIADYNVTAINDSRLIIIKEVSNSTWVIEEIEDKVIPQGYIKSSDSFNYTLQKTLRPGNYKFILLINGPKNNTLQPNQSFTESDIPWLTSLDTDYCSYEIFFATSDIVTIKKTEKLEDSGHHHPLTEQLTLKRYSSLIRLSTTGDDFWGIFDKETEINYSIKEQSITGINLLGQTVTKDTELSFGKLKTIIRQAFQYQVGDQTMFFTYFGVREEDKLKNILTPPEGKNITVTIFQDNDQTPPTIEVETQAMRNQVTTLILNKVGFALNCQSLIIGTPDNWDPNNIPWGHIELNFSK